MFPSSWRQAVSLILDSPMSWLFAFSAFAWVMMLIIGNPLIHGLKNLRGMKWSPREDTPDSHLQKAGTPSMGGLGILGAAIFAWLAALMLLIGMDVLQRGRVNTGLSGWDWFAFPLFLNCVLAHGALGFADDWSKARGKGGLSPKAKLAGQIVLATLFLVALHFLPPLLSIGLGRNVPIDANFVWFKGDITLLCLLLIIGTSNAVNLTDGIDGLAAGLSVQVSLAFSLLFLETFRVPSSGLFSLSTGLVWLTLGGACLGFLAFNRHPAKVFMGDTGSLALGAALGAGAILTRSVFLLPFVGFIFYIEMFSVIGQVAYFKWTKRRFGTGKRIFRRAPLHHHFELGGWSEWRVVLTFWAVNAATTALGLVLWKLGILPRFP